MNFEKFSEYVNGRLFEWVMTLNMLGMAVEIYIWPGTLRSSVFVLTAGTLGTNFIGAFCTAVGLLRFVALMLNGHKVWGLRVGPWIRSIASVFCAAMWGQFSLGLIHYSIVMDIPSPGIPLWSLITLGELYIAYRAIHHAR